MKRVEEKLVDDLGSYWSVEKGKSLEIVPGFWGDPSVLGFVGLGPDKTGGVGGSESADGSGVGEEGVVHREGNEAVSEGLAEECGLWEFQAIGYHEG